MDAQPTDVETDLIDVTDAGVSGLRTCDEALLAASMRRILSQIERPRVNVGSGPPGRAD